MSHFAFLTPEWPDIHEAATKAEAAAIPDPRTACFQARRALELLVHWLFKYESRLTPPYDESLGALIHAPTFKQLVGEALCTKARALVTLGNRALPATAPPIAPKTSAITMPPNSIRAPNNT